MQKNSAWAHTQRERPLNAAFSGFFFHLRLFPPFHFSRPNEAMQRAGGAFRAGGTVRKHGSSSLGVTIQIWYEGSVAFDGLLLLSFVIFLKPRCAAKVKQIWLIVSLVKIPHALLLFIQQSRQREASWKRSHSGFHRPAGEQCCGGNDREGRTKLGYTASPWKKIKNKKNLLQRRPGRLK